MQEYVNEEAQNLIDSGQIRIEDIGNNKESYLPLMENICSKMINALRRRSVTGIYVAFNTEDLDKRSQNDFIPTLYIRDLDPDSLPPEKNTDLLMERSPVELVKFTGISTDKGWKSLMSVSAESTEKFIYPVFQKAFKDQGSLRAADYGHWTTENYTLDGDDRSAIAYSIPLILDDGTVYGVLGVEMLTEYLNIQMPYEELQNQSAGTYMLAYTKSSLKESAVSAAKVHLWNSGDGTAVFLLRTCDQSTVNDDSADFTGGYFKQSDRQPQSCPSGKETF